MRSILKAGAAVLLMSFITANEAFAWCLGGVIGTTCGGGGGDTAAAPELDGAGAVAVIALLASVVAVIYQRVRR